MAFDPKPTIASQYASSPTLLQLIDNFNQSGTATADLKNFVSYVWSLDTAQGFGLDILGRIIGFSRIVSNVPAFYPSTAQPTSVTLTDDQYRFALYARATSNLSGTSAPEINAALKFISNGRGKAYIIDNGNMSMTYRFFYGLTPTEYAIIQQGNCLPRPGGVKFDIVMTQSQFGFSEANSWSTFGEAPFASY